MNGELLSEEKSGFRIRTYKIEFDRCEYSLECGKVAEYVIDIEDIKTEKWLRMKLCLEHIPGGKDVMRHLIDWSNGKKNRSKSK